MMRKIVPRIDVWRLLTASFLALTLFNTLCFAQRGVQISSVIFMEGDVVAPSITLTNFGATEANMSNWKFCSHDVNQVRVYSSGIGGLLAAGDSIDLNVSDFNLALPFDSDAYSLAIFDTNNGGFGGTANIVDHLQWSIDGLDDTSASFRSGQAVTGGVWTSAADWIATAADTGRIDLNDTTGGILHGPDNYTVVPNSADNLLCDFNADGECDVSDLDLLYANFGSPGAMDLDDSGEVDSADITTWLSFASDPANLYLGGTKTFLLGDVDLNGDVDSTDLGLLLNNFADTNGLLFGSGNLNGDANVDSTDLGLLLNNFGNESAAAAAVPEPRYTWWMGFCIAVFCRRYRSNT